ncbi:winged helix-turn-helix domain-containing protein [Streptomyces sp. PU-14G]|uniref:winged helix-turn-helix domain-containing protein n=1 Tax=Streptomyces sp. PU-14G TaxID=2800808 RepID=UPI0034E03890
MLRIHFTNDDLARTRIAGGPDPLWEILLSLHILQRDDRPDVFRQWRAKVRGQVGSDTALLYELAPPRGYSVDFLTPAGTADLEAGIRTVLGTPRVRLRAELATLTAGKRPTPWQRAVGEGRDDALRHLGRTLRDYHAVAVAPFWPEIRRRVEADRAMRAHKLLDHGLGHLLGTLHPTARWDGAVLTLSYGQCDRDLRLEGRGLVLVPSFFCSGKPICLRDPGLAPVLVHPVRHERGWAAVARRTPVQAPSARPLASLMGRTRAAALEAIAAGCTTTELARRLDISLAAASEHATTLRAAGLIATLRRHRAAHHSLTAVGAQLLDQSLRGGAAGRVA